MFIRLSGLARGPWARCKPVSAWRKTKVRAYLASLEQQAFSASRSEVASTVFLNARRTKKTEMIAGPCCCGASSSTTWRVLICRPLSRPSAGGSACSFCRPAPHRFAPSPPQQRARIRDRLRLLAPAPTPTPPVVSPFYALRPLMLRCAIGRLFTAPKPPAARCNCTMLRSGAFFIPEAPSPFTLAPSFHPSTPPPHPFTLHFPPQPLHPSSLHPKP